MVFHMPQKRIQLHLLKIAGSDIEFVDNFNFLGIIINKHINWTSHVDMLTAKLSKTIGILNTLKLPINILRTIYNSLILCHLNFGVLLWGPKLHVNDKLVTCKQLFCSLRTTLQAVTYTIPHYFKQFTFIFRNQQHNYATRTCQNVFIPNINHEFAKRSILFIAPAAYNSTHGNITDKIIYTHRFAELCI